MSLKRCCYCPKCDGLLVSERTERAHRNGPAFRQLEAALRQPGRQKRQKVDESTQEPEPSSGPPQFLDTNTNFCQSVDYAEQDVSLSFLQLTSKIILAFRFRL